MRADELLHLYEDSGALLRGHFLLRSGMHSDRYLQSALMLARPELAARAGEALADLLRESGPEIVLSPAMGGVIIGHETARALGVPFLFAERTGDDFLLRRGFSLEKGQYVAIVEDIVTTGGSVEKVIEMAEKSGAWVVSVGALVDRSEGRAKFQAPYHPVASLSLDVYAPDKCPLCRQGVPIRKPGSRGLHA